MSEFADKVRSLGFVANPHRTRVELIRRDGRLVGHDLHDEAGNTTHVRDESQSVTVRPEAVAVKVQVS